MTASFTAKLTNGFLVLRDGETLIACTAPSGSSWNLVNQTGRPVRLRLGTRFGVGGDEWTVHNQDGRGSLKWDQLLPADAQA